MTIWIALAIAYVALVVVRIFVSRRPGTWRGGGVWLLFAPMFLAPAVLLWVAVTGIQGSPVAGLLFGLVGLGYGALVVRMVWRIGRAAASATTSEEVANATVEPAADYLLTTTVLSVMGLIVIGVLAIVWAVASR